jgi:hypothetical protein
MPASALRLILERVEQNRLADAPQTGDDLALLGSPVAETSEQSREALYLVIATGERARSRARAGRVRIPDRVHRATNLARVIGLYPQSMDKQL